MASRRERRSSNTRHHVITPALRKACPAAMLARFPPQGTNPIRTLPYPPMDLLPLIAAPAPVPITGTRTRPPIIFPNPLFRRRR